MKSLSLHTFVHIFFPIVIILAGCKKEKIIETPTVITTDPINVTDSSAICGGEVEDDGGAKVFAKGICWNSDTIPTTSDFLTNEGDGIGSFVSQLSGLIPGTKYLVRAYATNVEGTSYGNVVSFTTLSFRPTIITQSVTSIGPDTAISGGIICSDGGSPILATGVCWSQSLEPTINDNHTSESTDTSAFSSTIRGLSSNTLYYVRAYATNSNGTAYGNQLSFTTSSDLPVVTTREVNLISHDTAVSGGIICSEGGSPVIAAGICWSESSKPTVVDNHTTDSIEDGSYTSIMKGLSNNTLYYVRAYATNSYGISYGDEVSFTTHSGSATVTTREVTLISHDTAVSGGIIYSDGGSPITAAGICWCECHKPTLADNYTIDSTENGDFVSIMKGLTNNTLYYVRAYVTNNYGTFYGNEVSFTTLSGLSTVTTREVILISHDTAVSGGVICDEGGSPLIAAGICWSEYPDPTLDDNHTTDNPENDGFTSIMKGLTNNTLYYVRAYVTNNYGTSYGDEVSFTTLPGLATVLTREVTSISHDTAVSGGIIYAEGGSPVTATGICWSEFSNPTTGDNYTEDNLESGCWTSIMRDLTHNTTYYVRAYATNNAGTAYGNELTFNTPDTTTWILIFHDDFESYSTGSHPSANWTTRFSGLSAEVSEDVAYEGSKSFKLSSKPYWARVEAVPLSDIPDVIRYEGSVYINQSDKGYAIGMGFKESANTYRFRNAINFNNQGKIRFGTDLSDWELQTWYRVRMECNFAELKAKVWINGLLIGEDLTGVTEKSIIKDFMLGGNNFSSGSSTAYFDDIKIYYKRQK